MPRKKQFITPENKFSPNPPKVHPVRDRSKVRGFFRINILDSDGNVEGDSGWCENTVPNPGKKLYLADAIGASSGSLQVAYATLGTGSAPGSSATSLDGETVAASKRAAVTYANSSSSSAVFTATFSSSNSFLTASANISNVALVNSSSAGTILCGNTYASSSVATNQNVALTYTVSFS